MTKLFGDDLRSGSYWITLVSITLLQAIMSVQYYFPGKSEIFLDPRYAQFGVPFLILLSLSLLPSALKGHVAHCKLRNPLPASRAFSNLINDNRVDVKALREKLGSFPRKSDEQNRAWYKLFQEVKNSPEVFAAHKRYILFRDLAVLHAIFLMAWCLCLVVIRLWMGTFQNGLFFFASVNVAGYILFVIASNNSGNRFVTTALAIAAKV